MDFRRLRLSGFKSFVEGAELIIEPGLTGVVGPNGCGKSNLLEAIRWVMGEGSAKSLRGGGMEDVIFAGTDQRPARAFAEVTLVLDNAARTATPPFDTDPTLEVTRRIERGLGSAYRVNGRDVRAKDVQLLFADAATGAHSPALVSQGRISAVIAAKPAERRALLEEASGISGLHVRRKDAEQKLRATDANLIRLDDVLNGMEAQAGTLRRQARAAERYRAVSDRIRLAEARLLFARWRDADAAERAARAEANAAEANVTRAADVQKKAGIAQGEAAKALHVARTAEQQAQAELARLAQATDTLAAERNALDRRIAELATVAANLARDRAREAALAQDAESALERLEAERTVLAARIDSARTALEPAAERVASSESATAAAEKALADAMTVEAAARGEMRVAEAAQHQAQQALARACTDRDAADREAASLDSDGGEETRRDAAQRAFETASAARERAEAAIASADQGRDVAAAQREAAQAEVATARANLSAMEIERAAVARMAAVPAEASTKASGQVSADPGYERALAAALGDDLDAGLGRESGGSRHWQGAPTDAGDPPLPDGAEPLAAHVRAPAELQRRLAQVGVMETDDGSVVLAVGQRLVTRDGVLRRWDGFVASDVGRATAERLAQANRLALIEAALPPLREAVTEAEVQAAESAEAVQKARAAEAKARADLTESDRAQRQARQTIDAATAAIERLAVRRAAAQQQQARVAELFAAAEAQAEVAAAAVAALPSLDHIVEASAQQRRAAEAARNMLAAARADQAGQLRALESDSARVTAITQEQESWRARAAGAAGQAGELAQRAETLEEERAVLAASPAQLTARAVALETAAKAARHALTDAGAALARAEASTRESDTLLAAAAESQAQAREARAGSIARAENYEQRRLELGRLSGERFGCPAPVLPDRIGFAAAELGATEGIAAELERLSAERERIGPVNLVAEDELAELEQTQATSIAEREELTDAIARLRGSIGALNREGRARLLAAFEAVDQHFRSLFTTLFQGGAAHLSLIDSDDPLEAGLEIMAQPPGKKLQSLTLLSGGEQALTAVALIFALFLTNPAPICVLDEVDAPLDDANVDRFCDLLDRMSADTNTRFLIVTHNAVTMSRMHRLFGVTMVERGISRLVSVDLRAAETLLAAE